MERDFLRDIIFRLFVMQRLGRVRFVGGGVHGCRTDGLLTAKSASGLRDDRCDLGAG